MLLIPKVVHKSIHLKKKYFFYSVYVAFNYFKKFMFLNKIYIREKWKTNWKAQSRLAEQNTRWPEEDDLWEFSYWCSWCLILLLFLSFFGFVCWRQEKDELEELLYWNSWCPGLLPVLSLFVQALWFNMTGTVVMQSFSIFSVASPGFPLLCFFCHELASFSKVDLSVWILNIFFLFSFLAIWNAGNCRACVLKLFPNTPLQRKAVPQ